MSLDLHKTAVQIEAAGESLTAQRDTWANRLHTARSAFAEADAGKLKDRAEASRKTMTFLMAGIHQGLRGRHPAPTAPTDHQVLATDGSHIEADRHHPPRCLLINIGSVRLQYGVRPDAELSSAPRLYSSEEELVLHDPAGTRDVPIEGAVLAAKRGVEEVAALADLCERTDRDLPALALMDGTLVMWGLGGGGEAEKFVRTELLHNQYVPALDRIRKAASERPLALAAYISLPRATEVVNLLRLAPGQCKPEWNPADCNRYCTGTAPGKRECDKVHGVPDRDLFTRWLAPGERSDLFESHSSVMDEYGEHRVWFYYLHNGTEVGRVEVPEWVRRDEALVDMTHTLVLDQCTKGQGYPVALMEAHEQAVVTANDRRLFRELVDGLLDERGLPWTESEKARSKVTRWV